MAVGGEVLNQLVQSCFDMPKLSVLRLTFHSNATSDRIACLMHLTPLGALPHLSTLSLQLHISSESHRDSPESHRDSPESHRDSPESHRDSRRIEAWLPILPHLTEFSFAPVHQGFVYAVHERGASAVAYELKAELLPRLHTLRLCRDATRDFLAASVPSVVVLDLSTQPIDRVLQLQDEILKLLHLQLLVLSGNMRTHVFTDTFDTLRSRKVALTFIDTSR
jgi:hypothetical protein